MSTRLRRIVIVVMALATVWFATVVVWAVRPRTDAVPVGVDYRLSPPRPVSAEVSCSGVFDGRDVRGTLPELPEQPEGAPPLAFQREPCGLVHDHARLVLGIDLVAYVLVMVGGGYALVRAGRAEPDPPVRPFAQTSA